MLRITHRTAKDATQVLLPAPGSSVREELAPIRNKLRRSQWHLAAQLGVFQDMARLAASAVPTFLAKRRGVGSTWRPVGFLGWNGRNTLERYQCPHSEVDAHVPMLALAAADAAFVQVLGKRFWVGARTEGSSFVLDHFCRPAAH